MNSLLNREWAKKLEFKRCTNRETDCQCILLEIRSTKHQSINLIFSKMEDLLSGQRIDYFILPLYLGTKEKLRAVEIPRS